MGIIPSFYNVFTVFFPLVCVFAFTPYMWKKNSAFGVILPDELKKNVQLLNMCRQYTAFSVIAGICLAATALVIRRNSIMLFCAAVYVIMCLAMFVMNNRLVRNIIAVNDYENVQKPVYVKMLTEEFKVKTISFLWLLILIIPTAVSFYDAYKNPTDIWYAIPVIQVFVIITDVIAFMLIRKTKQYVNKQSAADGMKRNITVRKQLSQLIFGLSLFISVFFTFMQLCNSGTISGEMFVAVAPAAVTVVVTVCIIGFCMKMNKGE